MKKVNKFRNPLYNHPLMSKSHSHGKTKKAERRKQKVSDKRDIYKDC